MTYIYGNPDPTHPIKFVKGLVSQPDVFLSTQQSARLFFKLLFEFWGFCVNGTTSTTTPGGFGNQFDLSLPINFVSGTSSLLAFGNDAQTNFGGNIIGCSQTNFKSFGTGTLHNKYITIWKPNDPSPDDSIYRIISVEDEQHIKVNVVTGGTTRLGGKASFSERSGIYYRIFDPNVIVALPGWSTLTQSIVLNFEAAPTINQSQLVPQAKIDLVSNQTQLNLTISPSGSWTGTSFSDAATTLSQVWFSGGTSGKGYFYFLGGRDFLICHLKGEDGSWSTTSPAPGLHIEIPKRLYPKQFDPNPITWTMWKNSADNGGLSPLTGSYANQFKMLSFSGNVLDWIPTVRCPSPDGTHVNYAITPASGGIWYGMTQANQLAFGRSHLNSYDNTCMTSDIVLAHTSSACYSTSRARLRRLRMTSRNLPPNARLGANWIHVGGGILWPWDGSQLPEGLFWDGGGAAPGEVEG